MRHVEQPLPQLGREVLTQVGLLRFPVAGNCMTPALEPGDVALVEPLGDAPPRVGEVMLFVAPHGQFTVHRVVAAGKRRGELLLAMKGDRTSAWDPVVPETALVGRVASVERAGQCLAVARHAPPLTDRLRGWRLIRRAWAGHHAVD